MRKNAGNALKIAQKKCALYWKMLHTYLDLSVTGKKHFGQNAKLWLKITIDFFLVDHP